MPVGPVRSPPAPPPEPRSASKWPSCRSCCCRRPRFDTACRFAPDKRCSSAQSCLVALRRLIEEGVNLAFAQQLDQFGERAVQNVVLLLNALCRLGILTRILRIFRKRHSVFPPRPALLSLCPAVHQWWRRCRSYWYPSCSEYRHGLGSCAPAAGQRGFHSAAAAAGG